MPSYKILQCTDEGITQCEQIIKSGGIVVFPTDTVYGIGCDPYDRHAVERIFRIKGRDVDKPLPVLAYTRKEADRIIALGRIGKLLADKYWPGALTIVSESKEPELLSSVTSQSGTIGVRVPANQCIHSLLSRCKLLVGTSANLAGSRPSRNPQEIIESGLDGFDILLDGGSVGRLESTIVDLTLGLVIREGAIEANEIYRTIGRPV